MGNYKFKLSDMIPNAWFYKLRDMSKPRKQSNTGSTTMFNSHPKKKTQPSPPTFSAATSSPSKQKQVKQVTPHHQGKNHHHHCHQSRKSYYFTRELNSTGENRSLSNSPVNPNVSDNNTLPHDPPRKSSRQTIKNRRTANRSTSSEQQLWSSSHSSFDSSELEFHRREPLDEPEFRCDRVLAPDTFDGMISFSTSNDKDIVIDIDKASLMSKKNVDSFSELDLPPIITKPENFSEMVSEVKNKKKKKKEIKEQPMKSRKSSVKFQEDNNTSKEHRTSSVRRVTSSTSPGVRLRNVNSPRIANKKINQAQNARRSLSSNSSSKGSLSESFAIVKSSFDPQSDFRDSMVEMILENNIKSSKDLEDLLACYLSLNADEYHDLIIQVFKQIWFDLTDVQSK